MSDSKVSPKASHTTVKNPISYIGGLFSKKSSSPSSTSTVNPAVSTTKSVSSSPSFIKKIKFPSLETWTTFFQELSFPAPENRASFGIAFVFFIFICIFIGNILRSIH